MIEESQEGRVAYHLDGGLRNASATQTCTKRHEHPYISHPSATERSERRTDQANCSNGPLQVLQLIEDY